ncbi:MAG TPA: hypothetical protein VF796_20735, partial [Humisphaera sp.]
MGPNDRTALLHGPYAPPPARVGSWLTCRLRGWVRVVGFTDAPVPWPLGRNHANGGPRAVVVCGDLARAVAAESGQAVQRWSRLGSTTVTRPRRAPGMPRFNAGGRRLWSA